MGETTIEQGVAKFCIKIFARQEVEDLEPAIVLFHEWIRQSAVPGLLIDVVDYRHVPDGPAVQLIGHEADYLLDRAEGPLGLSYNRKRLASTEGCQSLIEGLRNCLTACAAMERDPTLGIRFDAGRLRFISNDRLALPNDDAGAKRALALLHQAWGGVLAEGEGSLERVGSDPRSRLAVELRSPQPLDVSSVLERLLAGK